MAVTISGSTGLTGVAAIDNVSSTELGYLDGVTSAIQTQLNNIGKWQSWTPTITQGSAVSRTIDRAQYVQIGKVVIAVCSLAITGAGTVGQTITLSLPVNAVAGVGGLGSFRWFDAGNTNYAGTSIISDTTTVIFTINGNGNYLGADQTLANSDVFQMSITYEAG